MIVDPLAALTRPLGDGGAFSGMGARYSAAGEQLTGAARALVVVAGQVLGQGWKGAAADECATSCARRVGDLGEAARAFTDVGAVLRRYGPRLSRAQAEFDAARRLADDALAGEHQARVHVAAYGVAEPGMQGWAIDPTSPLRAKARAHAEQAILDDDAAAREVTAQAERYAPAPAPIPVHRGFLDRVGDSLDDFGDGASDAVSQSWGQFLDLGGFRGDISDSWSNLGHGIADSVKHPGDAGRAVINWKDLSQHHYAHWAGELAPSMAAAALSGGAGAAAKGVDGVSAASRTGKALHELSTAEKTAAAARGAETEAKNSSETATKPWDGDTNAPSQDLRDGAGGTDLPGKRGLTGDLSRLRSAAATPHHYPLDRVAESQLIMRYLAEKRYVDQVHFHPPGVPENWIQRRANNGKGWVWQDPAKIGKKGQMNAITMRLSFPDERYPHESARFYNEINQPIDKLGKPGTQGSTHFPLMSDFTWEEPSTWRK